MSDESRLDDSTGNGPTNGSGPSPLQREAAYPRRDRLLMPLVAAGCALAGVAVGFVLGERTSRRSEPRMISVDDHRAHERYDDDDDMRGRVFAFNWDRHDFPRGMIAPMPPVPPMPPAPPMLAPRELVVDGCGGDDDGCTTIVKRRGDGSTVIVKTRK